MMLQVKRSLAKYILLVYFKELQLYLFKGGIPMFDEPTNLEELREIRIPRPHLRVVLC